jgi:hypothetical protein
MIKVIDSMINVTRPAIKVTDSVIDVNHPRT